MFVIHSDMVFISVPVDPSPVYDSDVVYSLLKLFVAFRVYDKLCPSSWHRYFYLGGMWTGNSNRPYCREVKFSWRRKQFVEGKNKKNWGGQDDIVVACCGCRRWSQDQDGCNALED